MLIDEYIVQALNRIAALNGKKAFPNFVPTGVVAPFVVYQQITGSRVQSLQGDCGLANTRYQIDIYTTSAIQRAELSRQARRVIEKIAEISAVFRNEGQSYEAETSLYRQRMDFSFWVAD